MISVHPTTLVLDDEIQSRANGVVAAVVDRYAEAMRRGDKFPPVDAFDVDGKLLVADGFHRVRAAIKAGLTAIECRKHEGDKRNALLFAVAANDKHGLRRTIADRLRAVRMLLDDVEWAARSDQWVGAQCGVNNVTVRKIRQDRGVVPTRVKDTIGRRQQAHRPKIGDSNTRRSLPKLVELCSAPIAFEELCDRLSATPSATRARIAMARELGHDIHLVDETLSPNVDRAAHRLRAEVRDLNVAKKHLLEELEKKEQQIETLSALHAAPIQPVIAKRARGEGKRREGVLCMLLSDLHVEEPVVPEKVNGLNEYNLDIAERCVFRCGEAFEYFANDPRWDIRTGVLAILGDTYSGYIHAELQETNFMAPVQAVLWVQEKLERLIRYILAHTKIERLIVPCHNGNHGRCHDASTELLTANGWRKYSEIKVGDLVATRNMTSGITEWQKLSDVYVDHYTGPMVFVKTSTADYAVTPHHRMVVAPKDDVDRFVEMREFVDRGTFGSFSWPKCSSGHDRDYAEVTDDELRLLGWVMTDGSYRQHKPNGRTYINISQSKPNGIVAIRELLDRAKIPYSTHERHRPPPIICGKQCKSALAETTFHIGPDYGDHVVALLPDRRLIPSWMRALSKRQFDVFLEALLSGDGNTRVRDNGTMTERVLYKSRETLKSIQALCVVNGVAARLREDKRGDFVLTLPHTQRGHATNFDESVRVENYDGVIWCGTVPNGTLITRRNGVPLVSGNTTQKMRASTRNENSLEWLMYKTLAARFENEPRVEFNVAGGLYSYLDVYDETLAFTHGDQFRYQGGVGGLLIPVRRGLNEIRKYKPGLKRNVIFCMGHFHERMDVGDIVINGSCIGVTPYSLSINVKPERRAQHIFIIDSARGKDAPTAPVWLPLK